MKNIYLILLFSIMFSACSPVTDPSSIDKTLESSSKSLGNVNLVNDITSQNQPVDVNKKEENSNTDLQLNYKDQRGVEEGLSTKKSSPKAVTEVTRTTDPSVDRETTTLQVQEKILGTGIEAKVGNQVSVHYIGKLVNGNEFDNSYKRGQPITFELGSGQVIRGWDIAIEGMKVGGKRHLVIPPQLAYGDNSRDPETIPNGSTLIFDVELVDVK